MESVKGKIIAQEKSLSEYDYYLQTENGQIGIFTAQQLLEIGQVVTVRGKVDYMEAGLHIENIISIY